MKGAESRRPIEKGEARRKRRTSQGRTALSAMQSAGNETKALTQSDEADHHREDNRQQAEDFIHHAAEHISGHNLAQSVDSGSSFLNTFSFL